MVAQRAFQQGHNKLYWLAVYTKLFQTLPNPSLGNRVFCDILGVERSLHTQDCVFKTRGQVGSLKSCRNSVGGSTGPDKHVLLLETVKTNVFSFALGIGFNETGVRANAFGKNRSCLIVYQTDDTDFSGLLWRVVFRLLPKWLESGFQFSIILVSALPSCTSLTKDTPIPQSLYLLVAKYF